MAEYYNIYIKAKVGVTQEQVEKTINLAVDWYRYDDGLYIVYTTTDEDKWFERLKKHVDPKGYLFICKLDISKRNGWMQKAFWEWLKKPRK